MVTKTFDDIFEAQEANHMFLRAQRVLASERAPLAPAPLNLLGVPYFGFSLVRDLLQYCGCLSAGGSRKRSSFGDAGGSKGAKDGDVTNSKWWRGWKRKQRNEISEEREALKKQMRAANRAEQKEEERVRLPTSLQRFQRNDD